MIPKEFSVSITQEHIDRAVGCISRSVVCGCIVYQAIADHIPQAHDIGVGLDSVWIENYWYTPETMAEFKIYTSLLRQDWASAIPGKTIRFVLGVE